MEQGEGIEFFQFSFVICFSFLLVGEDFIEVFAYCSVGRRFGLGR